MAFKFQEASCVVVGTFNIYIIRPDWLGRLGLIPKGAIGKMERPLDQPGMRLSFIGSETTWTAFPNRLILETSNPNENCGDVVDRVLGALPYTPLMAIGCNFVFRGTPSDIGGWNEKTSFPPSGLPEEYGLKQRTWHVAADRDDQTFNIQVSEQPEFVEIRANVHTPLRDRDIDFARHTARRFEEFCGTSSRFAQELFDARITNGNN